MLKPPFFRIQLLLKTQRIRFHWDTSGNTLPVRGGACPCLGCALSLLSWAAFLIDRHSSGSVATRKSVPVREEVNV